MITVGTEPSQVFAYDVCEKELVYDRDMVSEANKLGSTFMMDEDEALHLLCRLNWVTSKFTECEDTGKMRIECGLPEVAGAPICGSAPVEDGMECVLCWQPDLKTDEVFLLSCNHIVCIECWQQNVEVHLNEYRPDRIECPVTDCTMVLFGKYVERVHPKEFNRYKRVQSEVFIRATKKHAYCTNPACDLVVRMKDLFGNPQVTCKCGTVFCFKCQKESLTEKAEGHYPATCKQFKRWIDQTSEGMMNFRQKPCPNKKCGCPIIKCGCPSNNVICDDKEYCPNQCCNHMVCPQCSFSFCWICLKKWDDHSDWYNCKFTLPEKQKNRTFLTEHLEAFLKYKDYGGNYQGYMDGRKWAKKMFDHLREEEKTTLTDNFLLNACEELAMCYHTLRNSYVAWYFQFHCDDPDAPKDGAAKNVTFFEHLQENLEGYTNQLSCLYDKDAKPYLEQHHDIDLERQQKLIDLTQIIRDYRQKLFQADEDEL